MVIRSNSNQLVRGTAAPLPLGSRPRPTPWPPARQVHTLKTGAAERQGGRRTQPPSFPHTRLPLGCENEHGSSHRLTSESQSLGPTWKRRGGAENQCWRMEGAVHGTYQAHAATLTLLRGTYVYPFTDRPRLHQQPYEISSRITLFYG